MKHLINIGAFLLGICFLFFGVIAFASAVDAFSNGGPTAVTPEQALSASIYSGAGTGLILGSIDYVT